MVVSGEKVKGNVWARLMIGQMGEYINVDQFRGMLNNTLYLTVILVMILLKISSKTNVNTLSYHKKHIYYCSPASIISISSNLVVP